MTCRTLLLSCCLLFATSCGTFENRQTRWELVDSRIDYLVKCLKASKEESFAVYTACSKSAVEKYPHPEKVSGLEILKGCMIKNIKGLKQIDIERFVPEDEDVKKVQACIDEEGRYVEYDLDWRGTPVDYLDKWQTNKYVDK